MQKMSDHEPIKWKTYTVEMAADMMLSGFRTKQQDLINQLYDIANNEEFTSEQRKGMMAIAFDEDVEARAAAHPTSLALDRALNIERMDIGIRISPNAGVPIGS